MIWVLKVECYYKKKENNGEVKRENGENIKWANLNAHKKCENLLYELLSKIVIKATISCETPLMDKY